MATSRSPAEQLSDVIDALTATLTSDKVMTLLAELAGVDVVRVPQPRVLHVPTQRPVTETLDLRGLRSIPDAGQSNGAHLLGDPILDLADPDDRHEQVRTWMSQIVQDAGLLGMDWVLDQLDAARKLASQKMPQL